jgi:hypothetical protein
MSQRSRHGSERSRVEDAERSTLSLNLRADIHSATSAKQEIRRTKAKSIAP